MTRFKSSSVELELEFFGPAKELELRNSMDLDLQFNSNSIGKIIPKHKNWNWGFNSNSILQFYGEPNVLGWSIFDFDDNITKWWFGLIFLYEKWLGTGILENGERRKANQEGLKSNSACRMQRSNA